MAIKLDNEFSSYLLTEDEEIQGAIFTVTQKQAIQNQLATCAAEKLRLEFDPETPKLFIQQEAYKRGQIEILQYLLESSEAAEQAIKFNAENPETPGYS